MLIDTHPQRYGQYIEHFIDRNSDEDANADEDGDGNPKDDNDDLFL